MVRLPTAIESINVWINLEGLQENFEGDRFRVLFENRKRKKEDKQSSPPKV
jgi:hypothetical protein